MIKDKETLWKAVTESLKVGQVSPQSVMDDCHIDRTDAIIALDFATKCLIERIGALFHHDIEPTDDHLNYLWKLYLEYLAELKNIKETGILSI